MAPTSKANYKSFEAQARLIRAIVAAHSDVKWNYKEIAACFGSDMTADALNHRFRRLRAESLIINEARKRDLDMKNLKMSDDLPKVQGEVDTNNISKYFGQSTADGIQFQFRAIKSDAKRLKDASSKGEDIASCPLPGLNGPGGVSSAASTPTKATPSKPARGTKRKTPIKEEFASDDAEEDDADDSSPQDWSEKDVVDTPTKKRSRLATSTPAATTPAAAAIPGQKNGTPARRAATKAAATIAAPDATASLSESYSEPEPPSVAPASIFGNPSGSPVTPGGAGGGAFARGAMDALISGDDGFSEDEGGMGGYYDLDLNAEI